MDFNPDLQEVLFLNGPAEAKVFVLDVRRETVDIADAMWGVVSYRITNGGNTLGWTARAIKWNGKPWPENSGSLANMTSAT